MVLKVSKRWELIGLASFTKLNANPQSSSGYTLIAPSVRFIQTHIHKPSIYPTILNCSCQCPRGFDSGYAFSTINSLDGCVNACMAVSSNSCSSSNTYACLGADCTYSNSYNVSTIAPTQDDQPSLGAYSYMSRFLRLSPYLCLYSNRSQEPKVKKYVSIATVS
jgi:hypothetical protein